MQILMIILFIDGPMLIIYKNKIVQRMRNTTNHFEPSQQLSMNDQNQFLLAPSRLTESNKDQVIKKLQLKNQRLMTQIQKVQKVLNQQTDKTVYGNKLPEVSSKVTQKQLENAYKQIKSYEYEINKLRSINKDGSYVQQVKKNQILLKQKEEISERLKRQLAQIKKQSMQLTKHLKNDTRKEQLETKNVKLSSQIKWLRQKLKQLDMKQTINHQNRQKQQAYIKKVQSELLEHGFPLTHLRNIKEKFVISKTNPNQSYYSNGRRSALKSSHNKSQSQEKQQEIQDRTPQAYKSLQNQIKLLQKMQKDYQSQIPNLQKQRDDATGINVKSRNKLLQIQDQIQRVQKRIMELKKSIDPAKIKPTRGQSTERYGDFNRSSQSLKSIFQQIFKYQQVGKLSQKGRRFADRIKLAKNQAKIISIDFYQNKQLNNLVGFQATYQIKETIKKGPINLIQQQKNTKKKSITLFNNDYIKSIQCVFTEKGVMVGIAVMSKKGVTCRAGLSEGFRRPINIGPNQYPACLYGSFVQNGFQLFGTQILQQKN